VRRTKRNDLGTNSNMSNAPWSGPERAANLTVSQASIPQSRVEAGTEGFTMRISQLQRCALILGLLATAAAFALPAGAQQLSSSAIAPATSAADAAPTAIATNISAHPVQNFESTPVTDLPNAPIIAKPIGRIGVERLPSRRLWIALSVAQHGAAVFDAYSTRQAIASGATEQNPLLKPFANSPAIYGATQVAPLILDYAARRMQLCHNSFVRRMWWVPQSTGAAVSIFAGVHNMGVANR